MFFIGGFSTILPYLIYISLVWIFILVGFNGKVGSFLSFAKQAEEIIISPDDQENIPENVFILGKDITSKQESTRTVLHSLRFSHTIRSVEKIILYQHSKVYNPILRYSFLFERGPPFQYS